MAAVVAAVEVIGPTLPEEQGQILEIANATAVFNREELGTVDELLADYYRDADASGYYFLSYRDGRRVLGFAVWGPRSLAGRGYDLYWVATHPAAQRRGVARRLLAEVEGRVRARGGGWLWVETSSTPAYAAARACYARCGYRRLAELDDFYGDGDGLVVYAKRI